MQIERRNSVTHVAQHLIALKVKASESEATSVKTIGFSSRRSVNEMLESYLCGCELLSPSRQGVLQAIRYDMELDKKNKNRRTCQQKVALTSQEQEENDKRLSRMT